MTKMNTLTPYSEMYKKKCFLAWYSAERPTLVKKIEEILPEDEYGRRVSVAIFTAWRNENRWDAQADQLDVVAFQRAEESIIQSKVEMLKEQAERARILQIKGMDYLTENDFDSSASAVQAVIKGAELEQKTRGLSEKLLQILELDDDGLMSKTQQLLERALESGEVIDVAEIEKEDDAESEE